jgi:hypothetical protein
MRTEGEKAHELSRMDSLAIVLMVSGDCWAPLMVLLMMMALKLSAYRNGCWFMSRPTSMMPCARPSM